MSKRMRESDVIRDTLRNRGLGRARGLTLWRQSSGAGFLVSEEQLTRLLVEFRRHGGNPVSFVESKRATGQLRYVRVGMPGISDYGGILPDGRYLGLEFKSPTGRLTTGQATFGEIVTGQGGVFAVYHNADELFADLLAAGYGLDFDDKRVVTEVHAP